MSMGYSKITEKPTLDSVSSADKIIVNQSGEVKQATVDTVVNGSSLNTKVGLLESLTTGVKTSIVNAINWVVTQLTSINTKIGSTDISDIGNGTVTGAISSTNSKAKSIEASIGATDISAIGDGSVTGAISTVNQSLSSIVIGSANGSSSVYNYVIIGGMVKLDAILYNASNIDKDTAFYNLPGQLRPKSNKNLYTLASNLEGSAISTVGLTINADGSVYHTSSIPRNRLEIHTSYSLN